jgi:hypothetical protein
MISYFFEDIEVDKKIENMAIKDLNQIVSLTISFFVLIKNKY